MNNERKLKLIEALKTERDLFNSRGQDTDEHDAAISFLKTGETSHDPEKYELLDAAMNDLECLCSDYDC